MKSLLTFLILCPALLQAQQPDKPITYTSRALPLHVVLDELSKQGGVKLKATLDMDEEPLILRLQGVPLSDVMAKMADVFAADWVDHGDYKRLERSDEKIAALRTAQLAKRVQAVKNSIDALVKLESQAPALNEKSAKNLVQQFVALTATRKNARSIATDRQQFVLSSQLPGMRYFMKVLAQMDPTELATAPVNQRIVYSTKPNNVQKPLRIPLNQEDYEELVRERELVSKALADQNITEDGTIGALGSEVNSLADAKPDYMIAALNAYSNGAVAISFSLYDANGYAIVSDYENLGATWSESYDERAKMTAAMANAVKNGFELDSISKEIVSHLGKDENSVRAMSPEAINVLMTPTVTDPLGIVCAETIIKGCTAENVNAVALLDDSAEGTAEYAARSGRTNLEAFLATLSGPRDVVTDRPEGWLVMKPIDPLRAQERRLPRPVLQTFLQRIMKDQCVTIETAADLLAAIPKEADDTMFYVDGQSLLGQGYAFPGGSEDSLRLFGYLSDQQRDAAKNGGVSIPISSLSQETQAMIVGILGGSNGMIMRTRVDEKGRSRTDYVDEPTSALGNASFADAVIKFVDTESDAAYITQQYQSYPSNTYPQALDTIAWQLAAEKSPVVANMYHGSMRLLGLRAGRMRTVTVTISFGDYHYDEQIQERHLPKGPILTVDQFLASLPKEAREKLEKEIQGAIDQMTRYQDQRAAKDITPPPATNGAPPPL